MKRIVLPFVFLLVSASSFSQVPETITLDFCYQQVYKTYPLAAQKNLLDRSSELRIINLNKNYLPSVNINGSASLQSDVTEVNISLPAPIPPVTGPNLSKDWYKISLDVNEIVYDGRLTYKQKKLESASLEADQKNLEAELYKLKDKINQLFFSIFLFQRNYEILQSNLSLLESRLKEVKAGVAGGTMMSSSADAIQVEIIRVGQQMTENQISTESAFKMLSELISYPVPDDSKLVLPDVQLSSMNFENLRPEYQLFDLQKNKLEIQKSMVISRWNPRLSAFGQAAYGRPGLNMFSNDFTTWWMVGARFSWNIWNWNLNRNERQILDLQSQIISSQKEAFDKNLRVNSQQNISEVLRLTQALQQDEDIVLLREKITKTASSQMENGIITSSEYINRLNEETLAKILRELHRVQLVKAKQDYLYTLGKL